MWLTWSSSSTLATGTWSARFELASSHARVTSIKSTKRHRVSEWVSDKGSQWSDSGPIKRQVTTSTWIQNMACIGQEGPDKAHILYVNECFWKRHKSHWKKGQSQIFLRPNNREKPILYPKKSIKLTSQTLPQKELSNQPGLVSPYSVWSPKKWPQKHCHRWIVTNQPLFPLYLSGPHPLHSSS